MTYNVLMGTLNPTITHLLTYVLSLPVEHSRRPLDSIHFCLEPPPTVHPVQCLLCCYKRVNTKYMYMENVHTVLSKIIMAQHHVSDGGGAYDSI